MNTTTPRTRVADVDDLARLLPGGYVLEPRLRDLPGLEVVLLVDEVADVIIEGTAVDTYLDRYTAVRLVPGDAVTTLVSLGGWMPLPDDDEPDPPRRTPTWGPWGPEGRQGL